MTTAIPATGRGLGAAFRRLFIAAVVTRFADTSRMAAFGVLTVTLTSDPRLVSALAATNFVPWLLFGLVAGALVDRWDKRRAFLTADVLRFLTVSVLVVIVVTGHVTIAVILVTAFLLTTLQTFASGLYQGILPLYALRTLDLPAYAYGALAGMVAVAMVGGNWSAGRLMSRWPAASISRNAVLAQTVAFLVISVAPTGWVTFLGVAGFGFSAGMWNVPWMSILMAEAPPQARGRVMAAYRTLVVSIYPAGAVVSGFVASWFGNRAPFLLCALCVGVAALHLTLSLRRSPHHPRSSTAGSDSDDARQAAS